MNRASAAAALGAVLAAIGPASSAAPAVHAQPPEANGQPAATPRIDVEPADSAVFANSGLRFHVRVVGGTIATQDVSWAAYGGGTIDESGLYRAPHSPGGASSIVATIGGNAGGARVSVVGPPTAGSAQALVACYADGAVEIRGAANAPPFGRLAVGDSAGDVAVGPKLTFAVVTSGDHLVEIDLSTMNTSASAPVSGARLGEVVLLAGGKYAAATNANAGAAGEGIAVFRLRRGSPPQLESTAPAGETPEGIAVDGDGRTMYVAGVNSNLVTRLVLNGDGSTSKSGSARTGTRPFGVAVDARDRMLLVADNDTPTLSGTKSRPGLEAFSLPSMRRVGAALSTGSPNALPLGVAADPSAGRLFVTNEGDDDVAVYALPSLRREATLRVGRTPWLPAVDTRRHLLFVPNARDDTLDVFDTHTLAHVAAGVPTCAYPVGVAVELAPPPV